MRALGILLAAAAIAASAHASFDVPGTPVPQTLQTLAVLAAGALLGARAGAAAVVLYVALGAFGVPVFADGTSGLERVLGPTGGYLAGFVLGAVIAGRAARAAGSASPAGDVARLVVAMLAAHGVILALGWAWLLTRDLSAADAFGRGVAPFVLGGALKSVAAAAVAWGVRRHTGTSSPPTGPSGAPG